MSLYKRARNSTQNRNGNSDAEIPSQPITSSSTSITNNNNDQSINISGSTNSLPVESTTTRLVTTEPKSLSNHGPNTSNQMPNYSSTNNNSVNRFNNSSSTSRVNHYKSQITIPPHMIGYSHKLRIDHAHKNLIIIHNCQTMNPCLNLLRQVEIGEGKDLVCDFECSSRVGIIYVKLTYVRKHKNYLTERYKYLKNTNYIFKIILLDISNDPDPEMTLLSVQMFCQMHDLLLICAANTHEVASYLEQFTILEEKNKNDSQAFDVLTDQVEETINGKVYSMLKSIRGTNKTNITNIINSFGTFSHIALADVAELKNTPGVGDKTAIKVHQIMNQPFKVKGNKNNTLK